MGSMGYGHVCNPYCGRCRPPKEKPLLCVQCDTANFPDRGEFGVCKKCGAELPERRLPIPARCEHAGLICANPCGKSSEPQPLGRLVPCSFRTPPSEEQVARLLETEALAGGNGLN